MSRRMMSIAVAILATAAAVGTSATASAAVTPRQEPAAVARASQPEPTADRNVRRTPDVVAAEYKLSDDCYGTTLPITCTITEPTVTEHRTVYPFSFLPRDRVTIDAGGCVQTGGSGATWKRYVDPAADNDLYHGLITIPSTTGDLERLVNVVGRTYVVGGRGGSLTLGYDDDGYSDNGYWGHDNGTGNQCLNSVNAYVHIVVS